MNRLCTLLVIAALLLVSTPSKADPVIGIPVAGPGSTSGVGNVSSNGTVRFFIPLIDVVEQYGVAGGGESSDSCSTYSGTCTGGQLDMTLYFAASGNGDKTVTIDFADLDVDGANDPWFLIEELVITDEDGNVIATLAELADLSVGSDSNTQSVTFTINTAGAFYLNLSFTSSFDPNAPHGRYRNTAEYLRATVEVFEPLMGVIFALGLVAVFRSRRRERTTAIAA